MAQAARGAGHKDPEIVTFFSDLQKRFNAIPGVRDVAMARYPMIGHGTWMSDAAPIGEEPVPGSTTHVLITGPGFFTAMRIPVLAGREIDQRDQPGSPPVAVVNEVFAKANFGDQSPLGQRISIRREPPFKEMECSDNLPLLGCGRGSLSPRCLHLDCSGAPLARRLSP